MHAPSFSGPLFRCDDDSTLLLRNGGRFIRKLPDDRSLGYLHKLYYPLDAAALERLRSELGDRLPDQHEAFLRWANGASLFDGCVSLFGLVEKFTRSVEPEAQNPICIASANRRFSRMVPERWEAGWTVIGTAVGWDTRYELQVHKSGSCALLGEELAYVASCFDECLETIVGRIDPCFSFDGLVDGDYAEIEAALGSLMRAQ